MIEIFVSPRKDSRCFVDKNICEDVLKLFTLTNDLNLTNGGNINYEYIEQICSVEDRERNTLYAVAVFHNDLVAGVETPIIGFAILENRDSYSLNYHEIEISHLVVHNLARGKNIGSKIVHSLIDKAQQLNFKTVKARVQRGNFGCLTFIYKLRWTENRWTNSMHEESTYQWYEFNIDGLSFSQLVLNHMYRLQLTVSQFAKLLGLSKQYINSFKNIRSGIPDKFPSNTVLQDFCLILAQEDKSIFSEFLNNSKNTTWSFKDFLYFNKKDPQYRMLYEGLNLKIVNEFLLSFTNLYHLKSQFIYSNTNILTKENINYNIRQAIGEKTPYEVWVISNFLGEVSNKEIIETTAFNIINNKIRYRFFINKYDESKWKLALSNILSKAEDYIRYSPIYTGEWNLPLIRAAEIDQNKLSIENYIDIYGVNETLLTYNTRIYNALSPNSKGVYDIKGNSENEPNFINLSSEVMDKLKKTIFKILANEKLLSSKVKNKDRANSFEVLELEMVVIKKFPQIE